MSQSEENALRYTTGEVAEIGDSVLIEHGRTPGELYAIIASDNDENEWSLEEPGFMVKAEPFESTAKSGHRVSTKAEAIHTPPSVSM